MSHHKSLEQILYICSILWIIWIIPVRAVGYSNTTNAIHNIRSAQTCGDPSISEVFVQGFTPSLKAHLLEERWAFVIACTQSNADYQIQGEIFRAWKTQEQGTVPYYRLFNPTIQDYIFVLSPDGNPPTVDGYNAEAPIGFVYPTQTCGSVPLYCLFQETVGDHWYTTIQSERDAFIRNGWNDSGIAAYVLSI